MKIIFLIIVLFFGFFSESYASNDGDVSWARRYRAEINSLVKQNDFDAVIAISNSVLETVIEPAIKSGNKMAPRERLLVLSNLGEAYMGKIDMLNSADPKKAMDLSVRAIDCYRQLAEKTEVDQSKFIKAYNECARAASSLLKAGDSEFNETYRQTVSYCYKEIRSMIDAGAKSKYHAV